MVPSMAQSMAQQVDVNEELLELHFNWSALRGNSSQIPAMY
jgi:hypothetical protein